MDTVRDIEEVSRNPSSALFSCSFFLILSAGTRFPVLRPGKQTAIGNQFLPIFPEEETEGQRDRRTNENARFRITQIAGRFSWPLPSPLTINGLKVMYVKIESYKK